MRAVAGEEPEFLIIPHAITAVEDSARVEFTTFMNFPAKQFGNGCLPYPARRKSGRSRHRVGSPPVAAN